MANPAGTPPQDDRIITTVIGSSPFVRAIRGRQPLSTALTSLVSAASGGAGFIYATAVDTFTRLALVADRGFYASSTSAIALYTLTAFGRSLGGTADAAAARTLLGITSNAGWPTGAFGPGSDGAVDLDGTNTYASFFSKSGNVYTMTRSMWATDVTVRAGCTLVRRYNLFVNGTLTVEATGIVHDDGNAASGGTNGAATGPGSRLPESTGTAGGPGRTTSTAGAGGVANTNAYGGAGGAGGTGTASGGAGGTITAPGADQNQIRDPFRFPGMGLLVQGTTLARANGGAGGGSGGVQLNAGTATSGAGGGGAPVSFIAARLIANSGTIRCNGGAGGNAAVTGAAVAGGGGGGGGGYLIIQSNTAQADAGTIQVNGGAGGAGAGSGATSGSAGSAGTIDYRGP